MIVIGERINGMFKDVKRAIRKRDPQPVQELAIGQVKAGASMLDVNVGAASAHPEKAMKWLVKTVQEVSDVPLALDSPKLEVIQAGLEVVERPPLINSCTADPEKLEVYIQLALEHDASLLCLTMDKDGVPQDVERRVECAAIAVTTAQAMGLPMERLFIDPIILPVNCAQEQPGYILEALSQFRYLSDPPPHMVIGLSNVSQGTKERSLINRTCLVLCMAVGLDAAILDPFDTELMNAMITAEVLLNHQIYSDSFLKAYRSG